MASGHLNVLLWEGVSFLQGVWYSLSTMTVRMRHTRGHTGNRRSHHALKTRVIVADKETGNLRLPHRLDEVTGMYKGKQIAAPKKVKATKKQSTKAEKAEEHNHAHHAHEHKAVEAVAAEVVEKKPTARPRSRSGMGS